MKGMESTWACKAEEDLGEHKGESQQRSQDRVANLSQFS